MAAIYLAECECGFKSSVSTGGNRATFRSICHFPYYCEKCGLVSVNIANETIVCPTCTSAQVVQYGKHPATLPWDEKDYSSRIQAFSYEAPRNGNLCPSCKKYSLVFSGPSAIFD
jgi:hypothetical protein